MRYINLIFICVFLFTGQAQAGALEEKKLVDGSLAILQDFMTAEDANIPDRKSTRLNSSHTDISRMPSSA